MLELHFTSHAQCLYCPSNIPLLHQTAQMQQAYFTTQHTYKPLSLPKHCLHACTPLLSPPSSPVPPFFCHPPPHVPFFSPTNMLLLLTPPIAPSPPFHTTYLYCTTLILLPTVFVFPFYHQSMNPLLSPTRPPSLPIPCYPLFHTTPCISSFLLTPLIVSALRSHNIHHTYVFLLSQPIALVPLLSYHLPNLCPCFSYSPSHQASLLKLPMLLLLLNPTCMSFLYHQCACAPFLLPPTMTVCPFYYQPTHPLDQPPRLFSPHSRLLASVPPFFSLLVSPFSQYSLHLCPRTLTLQHTCTPPPTLITYHAYVHHLKQWLHTPFSHHPPNLQFPSHINHRISNPLLTLILHPSFFTTHCTFTLPSQPTPSSHTTTLPVPASSHHPP